MFSEFLFSALANVLGDAVTRIWANQQEKKTLQQALDAAILRAEKRLLDEYGLEDQEIALAITQNTRFVDLPSVNAVLKDLLLRPLQNQTQPTQVIRQSFEGVLPEYVDRTRIAVSARRSSTKSITPMS